MAKIESLNDIEEMGIKYSKKDQAILDDANSILAEYDKSLLQRLVRDVERCAASEKEIKRAFLDDPGRKAMIKAIFDITSVIMPIHIIKVTN